MPRPLSEHVLRTVLDAYGENAELLSIEELSGRLSSAPPRRTLQRWLAGLVEAGRLQTRGEGRGRRYTLPVAAGEPTGYGIGVIPLSAEARHLREQVRRPQNVRGPVGYSSVFLADYTPNVSAYLPAKVRQNSMMTMSRTSSPPHAL